MFKLSSNKIKIIKQVIFNKVNIFILLFCFLVLMIYLFIGIEPTVGFNDIINWFVGVILLSYLGEHLANTRNNKTILVAKVSEVSTLLDELVNFIQKATDDNFSDDNTNWLLFRIGVLDNKLSYIQKNSNIGVKEIMVKYSPFREAVTNSLRSNDFIMKDYKKSVYFCYTALEGELNEFDLKMNKSDILK